MYHREHTTKTRWWERKRNIRWKASTAIATATANNHLNLERQEVSLPMSSTNLLDAGRKIQRCRSDFRPITDCSGFPDHILVFVPPGLIQRVPSRVRTEMAGGRGGVSPSIGRVTGAWAFTITDKNSNGSRSIILELYAQVTVLLANWRMCVIDSTKRTKQDATGASKPKSVGRLLVWDQNRQFSQFRVAHLQLCYIFNTRRSNKKNKLKWKTTKINIVLTAV